MDFRAGDTLTNDLAAVGVHAEEIARVLNYLSGQANTKRLHPGDSNPAPDDA